MTANTIADVVLPNDSFLDVNTTSGVLVGRAVLIQNKSSSNVLIAIATSQPAAASLNGKVVQSLDEVIIDAGSNKVWGKSLHGSISSNIYVEDLT